MIVEIAVCYWLVKQLNESKTGKKILQVTRDGADYLLEKNKAPIAENEDDGVSASTHTLPDKE